MTSNKADSSKLTIIRTHKQDEGQYVCVAKNALGENNLTFEVIVEGNCDAFVQSNIWYRRKRAGLGQYSPPPSGGVTPIYTLYSYVLPGGGGFEQFSLG